MRLCASRSPNRQPLRLLLSTARRGVETAQGLRRRGQYMHSALRVHHTARAEAARGTHRAAFVGLLIFTLLLYMRPNEMFPEVFGDFPLTKIVAVITLLGYFGSRLLAGERL